MANKRRAHDEEAWTNAKKIYPLTARQVEMARALGMNPRRLPGLRPSPQQRWKLPVGDFIEERYRKRFDGDHVLARHASADLADPGDSASAPPGAPSRFASRLSESHIRR